MIILVGASASGKTEIAKVLYQFHGYRKCITTTTRPPRLHETDGIDYRFLDKETFLHLEKEQNFLEVTHYQDHFYGIQRKDANINGVVILDPNGANTLCRLLKREVFIVYVDTKEETRKKRMMQRGETEKTIENRLSSDRHVFLPEHLLRIDLLVSNENERLIDQGLIIHQAYQAYIKKHHLHLKPNQEVM